MKKLNANWLTEGLIDFEYKKYLLLGYLEGAKMEFAEKKLYPVFSDLIFHYRNLMEIKENKKLIYEQFPDRISKADFIKLELAYKKIIEDDETMREIEDIIQFAIPHFSHLLTDGKEIYDYIESNLEINPVGITPMYSDEGYMFLNEYLANEINIYQYQMTIFENTYEKFRGIHTQHIETVRKRIGETYEALKIQLARRFTQLPNPATFVVVSKVPCPLNQSLLPIAKRTLVKYVSGMSA